MGQEQRTVEFEGFTWGLMVPSNIDTEIAEGRQWEPVVTKWILSHLKDGDIALDIGANIGWFTLLMARAVGSGQVWAFEPESSFRERLIQHIESNKISNVFVMSFAVSDGRTPQMFCIKNGPPFYSSANCYPEGDATATIADTIALDEWFDGNRLDMLKIDVDGCEDQVLLGGQMTIIECQPRIAIEVAGRDTVGLLEELGYGMKWERAMQVVTSQNIDTIIDRANPTINLLCEPKP